MGLSLFDTLGLIALGGPALAFVVLSLWMLSPAPVQERRVHQVVAWAFSIALGAVFILGLALAWGGPRAEVDLGPLFAIRGYDFHVHFLFDGPALFFLGLDYTLCGLIGAFSSRYLHQDEGYRRFYLLLLLFSLGVGAIASAAGLDLLFAGWEVVGLTSALLIAYFNRREGPSEHGLRAYAVYRFTDVGLLGALVVIHHVLGTTAFGAFAGAESALLIPGALLVFGAMGKGAMVPFTGWLPRAMEGPTPSSAIFYGALSIHASPFLLLRIAPVVDGHLSLRIAVGLIGALTLLHASSTGRVQTDVKTSLGYASVTQVSLIWCEIAMGWTTLAWIHLGGHALLRTWQLLRAPSVLHDRHHLARVYGGAVHDKRHPAAAFFGSTVLYRWALERWYLDELLAVVVRLTLAPFRLLDRLDRGFAETLEQLPEPAHATAPPSPHKVPTR